MSRRGEKDSRVRRDSLVTRLVLNQRWWFVTSQRLCFSLLPLDNIVPSCAVEIKALEVRPEDEKQVCLKYERAGGFAEVAFKNP